MDEEDIEYITIKDMYELTKLVPLLFIEYIIDRVDLIIKKIGDIVIWKYAKR